MISCTEVRTEDSDLDASASAVCDALRAGELIAHPTSTVYGIGGPATEEDDARICRLKGRPLGPLIRLVPNVSAFRHWYPNVAWPDEAARLAEAFWPGPLTLILQHERGRGFAVRAEPHPLIQRILASSERALSSTSLNLSGERAATSPAEVRSVLARMSGAVERVTFVASGTLPGPPPSTLVSLVDGAPRIVREGQVPETALRAVLGRTEVR